MTTVGATACRSTSDAPISLSRVERFLAILLAATPVLLALAFFPALSSPFFAPKTLVLTIVACASLFGILRRELPAEIRQVQPWKAFVRAAVAYLFVLLISSTLSGRFEYWRGPGVMFLSGFALCCAAARVLHGRPQWLMNGIAAAGLVTTLISLANAWLNFDLFAMFGMSPSHSGGRMSIIATLGNPNFVAAFLAATAPALLCLALQRIPAAWFWRAALVLQFVAAVLTGSRVGLAAFVLACAVSLFAGVRPRKRALLALAVVLALAAIVPLRNPRSFSAAMEGRLFIARVATVDGVSVLGDGPGSFAYYYPSRLGKWFTSHPDPARLRFADYQTHAHNDYLQSLIETGAAGATALFCFLLAAGWLIWRKRATSLCAKYALAGYAAIVAMSLFDYGLHRAEIWGLLCLWISFGVMGSHAQPGGESSRQHVGTLAAVLLCFGLISPMLMQSVATYHVHRAQTLEARSQEPQAVRAYRRAIGLDETNPDAQFYLARALANSGDLDAALDQTYKAQNWVDEAELYGLRARILHRMGRGPDAIRELQEGLQRFPFSKVLAETQLELVVDSQQRVQ